MSDKKETFRVVKITYDSETGREHFLMSKEQYLQIRCDTNREFYNFLARLDHQRKYPQLGPLDHWAKFVRIEEIEI